MSICKCDYCGTNVAYEDEGICDGCLESQRHFDSQFEKQCELGNVKTKNEIHEQVFNRYIRTY